MINIFGFKILGFSIIYSGEEREFQCENLEPGKSYNFRVQCKSQGGTSLVREKKNFPFFQNTYFFFLFF